MTFDNRLWFNHLKPLFNKVNKTIGLLRKLQCLTPRYTLFTMYQTFIRPHLDNGDIIYQQDYNSSFQLKIESVQYNSYLSIKWAVKTT